MSIWSGKKERFDTSRGLIAFIFFVFVANSTSMACPDLIPANRIPWHVPSSITREQIQLFAIKDHRWHPIPLQLDPMDGDGDLIFPVPDTWARERMEPFDRMAFSVSQFGERYQGDIEWPCSSVEVFEIGADQQFAYILVCKEALPDLSRETGSIVYTPSTRKVRARFYEYQYSERNHLVFDSIQLRSLDAKSMISVATRSDLTIIGDVKNFFTMVFDTDDIEAHIAHKRQGPVGLVGGLQFYLKILAFRIEMALLPEVNFFDDSLYMPMTMYLPIDAAKYLRRGSGVYYTWDRLSGVDWKIGESHMEILEGDAVNANREVPMSKPDPKYCTKKLCSYDLKASAEGLSFSLNFEISRAAADLGFFPRLIRDMSALEKSLGRVVSQYPAKDRIGVFFETAKLPKGTHKWNFWIRSDSGQSSDCRRPLTIRPISSRKVRRQ